MKSMLCLVWVFCTILVLAAGPILAAPIAFSPASITDAPGTTHTPLAELLSLVAGSGVVFGAIRSSIV